MINSTNQMTYIITKEILMSKFQSKINQLSLVNFLN